MFEKRLENGHIDNLEIYIIYIISVSKNKHEIICKHFILSTFPYNLFLVNFNELANTNFKMSTNLFIFDFIVAKFLVFFNASLDVSIGF
jgi:hypothetical protein